MTHDDAAALLAAYAVGAVRGTERTGVEEHLEACTACQAQLGALAEVVGALGERDRHMPDDIRAEIVAAIRAAQVAPPVPRRVTAVAGGARRWSRQLLVAAAVALVAGVAGLTYRQQERIDDLTAALQVPTAERLEQAAREPGADRFELRSADDAIVAVTVVTGSGEGYLEASALPALPAGRTYQLWGVEGDRAVSLALLGERPGFVAFGAEQFSTFAVTSEVAGGAVAPALPPLVQGQRP